MRVPLAVAGEAPRGFVDEFGYLHFDGGWRVEWWVGGDDHWHVPAAAASRRQRVVGNTPVVETVMRVPGGDVVWRAAAVASAQGGAVVVEFENAATIPVAIGIALITPDTVVAPASRPALHFTAPARAVAAEFGVELLVHPVSHAATWRCSIGPTQPNELPHLDAVVRGWQALARQGASISTGDPSFDDALAVARTSLLLHAGRLTTPRDRLVAGAVATALTLLGHEDEAEALRVRARLRPKRRGLPIVADIAPAVTTEPLALLDDPVAAAAVVAAARAALVGDARRRVVEVLPGARDSWRGHSIDVANLPTNSGEVSFALRWHGEHPALLWETPAPRRRGQRITVRAPALKPDWSTTDPTGETLLR